MSEPEGPGAAWTEERGTSDEGRQRLKRAPEASGEQSMSNIADVEEHWPVVSSAELLRARLVAVRTDKVRTPDNHLAERDVVLHPGAVAVLALDDADRILMIRQYRHPVGHLLWEIPAGLRDVAGEDPWVTAQRELAEEASYRARDWRVLADYYSSPGYSTERLRVFLARDLEPVPRPNAISCPGTRRPTC